MPRRSLLTIAILAGLLAAAAPAHAGTFVGNPNVRSTQSLTVFAGDAYDNEMGVRK
jgi:hypothetical protein